jgi:phosphoglycerate dehydrogenase-like enzyme
MAACVIITEPLDEAPLAWLREKTRVEVAGPASPAFHEAAPEAEAIIVRTHTRVDAALLDRLPRLAVIGRAGVGLDNIDLPACAARGIPVLSTPDANSAAVAEFVFASLLRVMRPITPLPGPLDRPAWDARRAAAAAPRELSGLSFAVLGLGRIGTRVARVAAALDMNVLSHDIAPVAAPVGCTPVPFDELLARADILSIHVDGRAANRHLIDAAALARLKPSAMLINTSRGLVIDEPALAAHLAAHPAALAMLDVHAEEPVPAASPLLAHPRAILTAHEASCTVAARRRMSWIVRDIWAHLASRPHA